MSSMVDLPEEIQVRMTKLGRQMSDIYKKHAAKNLTSSMRRCFKMGDGSFEQTWDDPNDVLIFEYDNQGYCDDLMGHDHELPADIMKLTGDDRYDKAVAYAHKQIAFDAFKKKFDDMAKKANPKFSVQSARDEQWQMWLHCGK